MNWKATKVITRYAIIEDDKVICSTHYLPEAQNMLAHYRKEKRKVEMYKIEYSPISTERMDNQKAAHCTCCGLTEPCAYCLENKA